MHSLLLLFLLADPAEFELRQKQVTQLLDRSEFQAAANEAQAIQRQWPDDVEAHRLLAAAHLELGNYAEARRALDSMLDPRIGKADVKGYWLLARFREETGDGAGSIEAMKLALEGEKSADHSEMLEYLARLYVAQGKLADAGKVLQQLEPGQAVVARAELLLAEGKREEAIDTLYTLAKRTGDPRHCYALAVETGDYTEFERATKDSPVNVNRELALYLASRGNRPAEALAIAQREAARRHDVFTQDALAFALAANGRLAEAQKVMEAVLAVGTVDPGILERAALLRLKAE